MRLRIETTRLVSICALVLGVSAFSLSASAQDPATKPANSEWQTYELGKGSFSVLLPDKPVEGMQSDKNAEIYIYTVETSWGVLIEGLAPVMSFNKIGFINKEAKVVIEPLFRGTKGFSEGLAGVKIIGSNGNYVWGFIDRRGKFAIDAQFKEVQPFAGGLAHVVTLGGKEQLIDSSGKVVWQGSQ